MLEFGVTVELKVHLRSDERDMEAAVTCSLGVNQVPTKERMDEAIKECIAKANEAAGVDDFRLVTLSDLGFAEPADLKWEMGE